MNIIGSIGDVVFTVSAFWVQTFEELRKQTSARFATHDVIMGKPVSEFTGANLQNLNFEIMLHSTLDVDPASLYESLQDICENGKPQPVFLEGENKGLFNILNVEGETTHWAFDRPAVMSISLVLQEYVESLPTVAEQKLREDELKREDTGKGGPERLPGTGAPTQARNLTPATSNETGFVSK